MINVGVVSANSDVAFNMSSVVCRLGSHCEIIREYEFTKLKEFNIIIVDLDNVSQWHEDLKKDSSGFEGFVIFGVTRSPDLIDIFSPIFKVVRKPLRAEHVKEAITELKDLVKVEAVVNTEATPVYTQTGNPTFKRDPINTDVFSDEEMTQRLSKIINEKYKGPSEKAFLKKIDADQIPMEKQTIAIPIVKPPLEIDLASQFVDDALIMYRAKKFKQKRLTHEEIVLKVKELLLYDASHNTNQDMFKSSDLEEKFNKSNRLTKETLSRFDEGQENKSEQFNKPAIEFDDTDMDIEAQRREAIGMHEFVDDTVHPSTQPSSPDSFSEKELKYIRNSNSVQQPQKTVAINPGRKAEGVGIDKTELSKKIHGTMTPEQIEKLRKLGVKI